MIARVTAGRGYLVPGLVLFVAAIAFAGIWHHMRQGLRRCEVEDALQPIASLLEDNRKIVESLKRDGLVESESAILDTYLQDIRRDGVPKYSAMKQRIDTLANNNAAILALLSKYAAHARTPAFRAQADKFRDYAISFRDRWQSVFEIFMAGGNLPTDAPAVPPEFSTAVSNELTAAI
jgi:hypothetical protein